MYVHIPESGVWWLSKKQGLGSIGLQRDSDLGDSDLGLGKRNSDLSELGLGRHGQRDSNLGDSGLGDRKEKLGLERTQTWATRTEGLELGPLGLERPGLGRLGQRDSDRGTRT